MPIDSDGNYYSDSQDYANNTNTVTYDDGSTITYGPDGGVWSSTDSAGNPVSVNNGSGDWSSTPPQPGARLSTDGKSWLDAAGNFLKAAAPALAGLAAGAASPWLTNLMSGGALKEARTNISNAVSDVRGLQTPNLSQLIPQLRLQVQQGSITPAQMQAALQQVVGQAQAAQGTAASQSDTNLAGVQTDAGSIAGQRAALERLAQVGQSGMTEADRAQLAAVMNQTNANAAQQRAAQIQQLQMQGNAGTGAELAARLSGVQGAANQNALEGANVASAAQQRALQAIQSNLTGNANLNTQLFNQQAQKAQAQDVVNQFNAQAMQAMAQQNTSQQQAANMTNFNAAQAAAAQNAQAQNAANVLNASNQQAANVGNFNMANTIAGTNTGIMNQQAALPYKAAQDQFGNQLNRATAAAGAGLNAGKLLNEQGNIQAGVGTAAAQAASNAVNAATGGTKSSGSSGGGGGGGGVNWGSVVDAGTKLWDWLSDEDLKKDKKELTDKDIDEMFGSLTGYKYRYKGSKNPVTQGVMAQDIENGPMKQSVVDTPAGKMVAGNEMFGKMLAALANNTARINKLEGK